MARTAGVLDPNTTSQKILDAEHIDEPLGPELPDVLRSLTPEEMRQLERRVVRKLDVRLMTPLILMYILNYLDRNAIAAAKVSGIIPSLGLTDSEYQTCISVLFVGYILMQVPSNLFLNKIGKPSIYLPICMIVWGTLCAATGAIQSFSGLAATRFLLGFTEAAYFPGCMLCLTIWYTRKELALRTALLYCGSLVSGAFSGLIAAGITSTLDGAHGLPSWRWLFIIEGSITVAVAMIVIFILPDFPSNTKWMSEQERAIATWRQAADIGEEDTDTDSLWKGFQQCISDYKTWVIILMIVGVVSSGTINSYFPTIVQTIGYGNTATLLLTAPPYLLSCFVALGVAWNSDRTGERYLHFTVPTVFSLIGFIISMVTLNTAARYFSMMIMLPGVYTAYIIGMTWLANCLPRPPAKRAAALALSGTCSNCSSIYGPFLYPSSTAPRYLLAMGVNAGTCVMSIFIATGLRFHLKGLNRRLDRAEQIELSQGGEAQRSFRYLY